MLFHEFEFSCHIICNHVVSDITASLPFYRNDPQSQAESEGWIEWYREYLAPYENAFEPVVDLYYPIINNITRVDLSTLESDVSANNTVVALIVVNIYWRDCIRDILPEGSNGIVVVVDCSCNEQFTYEIFGSEVKYLGVGDVHDVKYHHMERNGRPANFTTLSLHKDEYSGLALYKDFCPYTLRLYPSDAMKNDFIPSNGVMFMVSTIFIFVFTSMVFYLYDWKEERRQHRVSSSAQQSSAIISSLFPSTVRDQSYDTQTGKDSSTKRKWGFPTERFSPTFEQQANERIVVNPIAQLYEETTVIFMDIVGFTQWSASRQPFYSWRHYTPNSMHWPNVIVCLRSKRFLFLYWPCFFLNAYGLSLSISSFVIQTFPLLLQSLVDRAFGNNPGEREGIPADVLV
jgi:hypothetical protein